jgi:hypothetical protein
MRDHTTPPEPTDYRVLVTEHRAPGLVNIDDTTYQSPPQTENQARALIALLTGTPSGPPGRGPWRRPIAGGQRIIELASETETEQ